ncbi:right-handed parallel beta-helix repeat-containing protein [Halobacterium wangiae]|uniref:right-handed parallel beta-helix repeat-containing protein n=1 Tax=Halobacterium wangiae TaxID=2902623 RepID=UPI001E5DC923|nr:right-handed parallel beta-helix repeat-containing protein [Halobacterium wangiae]
MSNSRPDGVRRVLLRVLVVLVAAIVVTSPVTVAVATPTTPANRATATDGAVAGPSPAPETGDESRQESKQIDSCTTITEPGRYELSSDVSSQSAEVCIHVRASDVVLDGNNHTVAGNRTNDSVGVLVYSETPGAPVERNQTLSSVTVQDLRVTDWERGVVVGDIAGIGTEAHLLDVVATNNTQTGVRMTEAEGGSVENVTATENRDGFSFWEVSDVTARNVTASDNDQLGFGLYQNVENNTFRNVTATGNGPVGYASAGIYLSTDVVNNVFVDAYVANNDGPGVRFSDSFRNELRNVVVESNANRGLFGARASGEYLQNVTFRDNGGPEVELTDGGVGADELRLDTVASLSFRDEQIVLEPFDTANLSSGPPNSRAADRGVELSNVRGEVTLTFDYDGEEASARLWRYDGSEWTLVHDVTVDETANTLTGTVTDDGRLVAAESTLSQSSGNDTGVSGADAPFVVRSLRDDADFTYEFVVGGTVEPHATAGVSADSEDTVSENGDGTATVTGETGNAAGDAFLVTGEIVEFTLSGVDSGYELTFAGEDVTGELAATDRQETESDGVATGAIPANDVWYRLLFVGTHVAAGGATVPVAGS